MSLARSLLYYLILVAFTLPWTTFMILCFWLPHHARHDLVTPWIRLNNWLIWHLLGVTYEVRGRENIPGSACVILAKHQSAWETFIFQEVFRDTVFAWKKELKQIPFFGWALAVTPMISINREAGVEALRHLIRQGKERIAQNYNVVIFPEGTRSLPGSKGDYKSGGAAVARAAEALVLPVAQNSGEVWGRHPLVKSPGHIIISIGPAIHPQGLNASKITARAEAWIEAEMRAISPHRYPHDIPAPRPNQPAA